MAKTLMALDEVRCGALAVRVAGLACLGALACSGGGVGSGGGSEPGVEHRNTSEEKAGEAGLPSLLGTGDCGRVEEPAICTWALSADAIVTGELVALRPAPSPAWIPCSSPDGALRVLSNEPCPGILEYALDLEVRVTEVLHGVVPAPNIFVRVGAEELAVWRPLPRVGPRAVEWWGEGDRLVPGLMLGLVLHWAADWNRWLLHGEPLLQIEETDGPVIDVQEHARACTASTPSGLDGMGLERLRQAVAGCRPVGDGMAAAEQRRRHYFAHSDDDRTRLHVAATCFVACGDPPHIGCEGDADCGAGERCVDNACQR